MTDRANGRTICPNVFGKWPSRAFQTKLCILGVIRNEQRRFKMPYSIAFDDQTDHLHILRQFLDQTIDFFRLLFKEPEEFGLAYIIDISSEINRAFDQESASTDQIMERLQTKTTEQFYELGLAGESIRAKATGLNLLGRRIREGAIATVKWLLGLINSLLGSLGKLTWLAEALKEIKDLFENSSDFRDAVMRR